MGSMRRSRILPIALACILAYLFVPPLFISSDAPHHPHFDTSPHDPASRPLHIPPANGRRGPDPGHDHHVLNPHHVPPPEPPSSDAPIDHRMQFVNGIPVQRISYNWAKARRHFPVTSHVVPPSGPAEEFPAIQFPFPKTGSDGAAADPEREKARKVNAGRRDAVKKVFDRDWNMYRQNAWMHDELEPLGGHPKNPFGGWAATMVDALDSLWILGMQAEFHEAVQAVAQLDWAHTVASSLNVFETTIRHLGGLLSAYSLSGEDVLLVKATELGDLLHMAFDTPNHMPPFWLSFSSAKKGRQVAGGREPSAAMGTLSMEFAELSRLTGNAKYFDAIDRVKAFFQRTQNTTLLPGLWPLMIDFRNEKVTSNAFTLGGGADSLYEYLPKMDILLGGRDPAWREMALPALDTALEALVFRPMTNDNADILFSGRMSVNQAHERTIVYESEHLTCFVGGMYMMSGKLYNRPDYLSAGEKLARGCGWAYSQFPTGVMPEGFEAMACSNSKAPDFPPCTYDSSKRGRNEKMPHGFVHVTDGRYIMRPEAIESVYYAYRITGKEEYREMAWEMWKAVERVTRAQFGHSGIADVTVEREDEIKYLDSMESFWFAETLKYFYLIFSEPELISLDDFVFNTEAHPFPRPSAGSLA